MIFKIVTLFLVVIAVLGMFGKFRLPKVPRFGTKKVATCNTCGAYKIGKGPCACEKRG
jgi:hypothetical protein